nr:XdhC family protein [Clostridia bacterium]
MRTIFAKLLYEMEKGHDAVLVTIVGDKGSAPRGAGSQMLVSPKGRVVGTVGGGAVEKRSEEKALELLEQRRSLLHEFQLYRNAQEDIGMLCGGDVAVLFQFISAQDKAWSDLAAAVMRRFAEGQATWFVQQLDGGMPSMLDEDGNVLAGADIRAEPAAELKASGNVRTVQYFSMPLPMGERAVIFGGGHIAQSLVPILKSVDFRPTVYDDRPEYAAPERFPDAEQTIAGRFDAIADFLTLSPDDYVVVVTDGHSHDFEVQEQALRMPLAYIGVIGSR